jgi:membrane fusion protein, multidrug efflux system
MAKPEAAPVEEAATVRPFPTPERARAPQPVPEVVEPAPAEVAPPAPPAPATPQAVPAAAKPPKRGRARRIIFGVVALLALAFGGWWGADYLATGRFQVSTDDAYVGADLAIISPKVMGYVAEVNAVANQSVKAGDPLVTLDGDDYRIARDQAKAQIASQELTLKRIDAQRGGAEASIRQAQAQVESAAAVRENAAAAQKRAADLVQSRVGAQANLDVANATLAQADAALAAARAQVSVAQANADVLAAQRDEAGSLIATQRLALEKAERDLSFTVLRAPYDGIVGNVAVQKGNLVSAGNRLLAVVPADKLYVDANYKETQLGDIVPGEKAAVSVDAWDAEPVVGTVESIAPASGAVFSLLPPENATGNFTKVVQRVPVRIKLPPEAFEGGHLRAGLSVVVDIDTRTRPGAPPPEELSLASAWGWLKGLLPESVSGAFG